MIISASRRTDIPAFYADWFFNRLAQGYALVRNPKNYRQVGRVALNPDVVEGIVFWTKNAKPMLNRLHLLKAYPFYFQFTVTPYGPDLETNLPDKLSVVADTFCKLADKIGPQRVVWRYCPILLNKNHSHGWHLNAFERLAQRLAGHTEKCIIGFLDFYPKLKHSLKLHGINTISAAQKYALAKNLAQIAFSYKLKMDLDLCDADMDLSGLGIEPACCIDARLIERIGGYAVKAPKDRNQPLKCNCAASIDIGAYSTCNNGCKYCYANSGTMVAPARFMFYDVNSPMLCDQLAAGDVVKDRHMPKFRLNSVNQPNLFD